MAALIAYTFYRSMTAFLLLLPFGLLYPLYQRRELQKKRARQLSIQFKEGIVVLSSFLRSGYSLENSLSMSVRELETLYGKGAMITEEFRRLASGRSMNRPVEGLLRDFGERSGLSDIYTFAQVFAAARRRGGELVTIISQTADVIRDKIQVQEEIHTLTASRAFEQRIMNGVPFGIVLYINFTSPGFFQVMYETAAGRAAMTICLLVYGGAIILANRILEIEI